MTGQTPSLSFWKGKRVLVTGHTGFKGAWLSLWLTEMGADVHGLALQPEHDRCVFNALNLPGRITSHIGDLRDRDFVDQVLANSKPEVIFHLAAQALVRRAHADPQETYSTNLVGLAGLLESAKKYADVKALIVATSDKVYENRDDGRPFSETDRLGGFEPYGVSKAVGELIVEAFKHSLDPTNQVGIATVRAGNVIGGGDWAEDRLIPDAINAFTSGQALELRNPNSTRPWQHVFDPLAGYILLAEQLSTGIENWRAAWNFGPDAGPGAKIHPVREIADQLVSLWNAKDGSPRASWADASNSNEPYEARLLSVDSQKARNALHWTPRISLEQALDLTVSWYLADQTTSDMYAHAAKALHDHYPIS